jgi:hypothetical protein
MQPRHRRPTSPGEMLVEEFSSLGASPRCIINRAVRCGRPVRGAERRLRIAEKPAPNNRWPQSPPAFRATRSRPPGRRSASRIGAGQPNHWPTRRDLGLPAAVIRPYSTPTASAEACSKQITTLVRVALELADLP